MSRYLHSHSLRLVYARGKICTHTKNKKQKNRANFYANLNAQKKARARSDDINYLCCSQTWKKPRFQLKMPFAWLSLTCLQNYSFSFSIFFCCDDAVCTTTCFFFFCFLFWPKRPLSWKAERGGASRVVLFCKNRSQTVSRFRPPRNTKIGSSISHLWLGQSHICRPVSLNKWRKGTQSRSVLGKMYAIAVFLSVSGEKNSTYTCAGKARKGNTKKKVNSNASPKSLLVLFFSFKR